MLSKIGAWAILMNVWPWVVFPASYFEFVSALWILGTSVSLLLYTQRRIIATRPSLFTRTSQSRGDLPSWEITIYREFANSKWGLGKRFIWNCHLEVANKPPVDYLNKRETGILEQNQPLEEMWIFSLFPPCLTTWGFLLLGLPIYPFLSANHNLYPTYKNSKFWKS